MNAEHVLKEVLAGGALTDGGALLLLNCSGDALRPVFEAADAVNQRLNGRRVSFVHNMNVNYTNICEYFCSFCEFGKAAGDADTYILKSEEMLRRIEGKPISEITFQGGLTKHVKFSDVLALVRAVKKARPEIHMHAFSPEEIHYYAKTEQLSYAETLAACRAAGQDSLCGTAAEILDDEIRAKICPTKIATAQWLEIVETAHRLGLRSTATILFGHIEAPEHVVRHLARIRALQERTHGFTEFIPLLFMPDDTRLGRRIKVWQRDEYALKLIAVARLYFSGTIRNVQTSWVKLGLDHALDCLDAGANDMGGTLYYENITREAGGRNGEYTSLETFYERIRGRGKMPIERDTLYSYQQEPAEALAS